MNFRNQFEQASAQGVPVELSACRVAQTPRKMSDNTIVFSVLNHIGVAVDVVAENLYNRDEEKLNECIQLHDFITVNGYRHDGKIYLKDVRRIR